MVVTALVAVPRRALADVGGFSSRFDKTGWGCDDTYVGAALIGAGLMVAPLEQLVCYHVNPPDEAGSWQAKLATWPATIALYRELSPADQAELEKRLKPIGAEVTKDDPVLKAFYDKTEALAAKYQ